MQVNQYTQTPRDYRQYDEKGNLVLVATPVTAADYEYDAYDRLVVRTDSVTGDSAHYAYDALRRRISKTITPGIGSPEETRYFYDGRHVIEEQDAIATAQAIYVRGVRGSDIVCVERGGQVYYQHADDQGNATALTDTNGIVIERYEYGDFGSPQFIDGAGTVIAGSAVDHLYLFGGRQYDPETGWYLHDTRYFDPENGRYVTRDRSGMGSSDGNAYTYAGGNPWSTGRCSGEFEKEVSILSSIRGGDEGHSPLCKCRKPPSASGGHIGSGGSGSAVYRGFAGCGAGKFSISCRAARAGRNRQTGKEIKIAAKSVVKFKAGAALAKAVNIAGGGGGSGGGVGQAGHRGEHEQMCYKCHLYRCICRGGKTVIKGMDTGGGGGGGAIASYRPAVKPPRIGIVMEYSGSLSAANNHCPGCGAMLCRCKDTATRSSKCRCGRPNDGHRHGHVTVYKRHAGAAAFFGGAGPGGGVKAGCNCWFCGKCSHGNRISQCPEEHLPILPATNNIPKR